MHGNDGWKNDLEIMDEVDEYARKKADELLSWDRAKFRLWTDRDSEFSYEKFRTQYRADLNGLLGLEFETEPIRHPPNPNPHHMALRIDAFAIYKIGKTLPTALRDALAIVLAFIATSPYPFLLVAWGAMSFIELVRLFRSGYEKLEDENERLVFEAVHTLSAETAVTNYDALEDGNFHSAIEVVAPTKDRIIEVLQPKLSREDIEKTLQALKQRDVFAETAGRWRIVF